MINTLLIFIMSQALAADGHTPDAKTLDQCFQAAIKRSEIIGTQTELINQAEERYKQSKAAIFPTISAVGTYLVQQTPPAGTATSISPSEQTTAKITASQPLFHGMSEYAAILQQNLLVTAQMSAKKQAAALLYSDVAQNFYQILTLEQDLRDLQSEIDIDQKRMSELGGRVRIGRSRSSEVLTIRSAVDTLSATAEVVKGQLLAAREVFAFLTGLDRDSALRETETLSLSIEPLDAYLKRIEDRPDVKSARDNLEAVEKNVTIARGGHLPSVDLNADYFFKRPGISQSQKWAVQITGTVPIFSGGAVNSAIRLAASQTRASELALGRTRRLADQEIRSDFDNYSADLAQVTSLTRAMESSRENFQAQSRDYRLGLVTNLDVLQSITSSQQSLRSLNRGRFQAKLDFIRLQIATAHRPRLEEETQ